MTDLDTRPYLQAIEETLSKVLTPSTENAGAMYTMMRYHLGWEDEHGRSVSGTRGKRVRPLLCLLACDAVSHSWRSALPAACALELVHNFSLIHDDIEDRSETRRHRPTVWSLWGVAQALNTGDAMWAIARLCIHRLSNAEHAPETVLRVAQVLDETCLRLCTGQYMDLHFEELDSVALTDYEQMIEGKTAALIAAALQIGAILGTADGALVSHFANAGRNLGLTFQIVDDILGIWGDSQVTGKSAATDILSRKKTLPVLYAHEWERQRGYADLARLYADDDMTSSVEQVLALLDRAGAREYAQQRAQHHLDLTLASLDATRIRHPAMATLRDMAGGMITRTY